MKKMFLKLVLFCFWHLDGVFGDEVESVTAIEGHEVTLHSNLTEKKDDDVIQWRFGSENTLLAKINKQTNIMTVYDDVLDGRFRNRLKLDHQTGCLTITNTRPEHSGRYELQTNSVRKYFKITVFNSDADADAVESLMEGDSVTLHTRHDERMNNDRIQWWFENENSLIAEMKVTANGVTVNTNYDWRFRGKLKVNLQTGCLTITNIRTEHAGLYGVQSNRMRKTIIVNVSDAVKSVMEGDSVTLHTLHERMDNDRIQWWFENKNTLIAEMNVTASSVTVNDNYDRRFRRRLKVDLRTGCLTITNIRTEHAGLYGVQSNRMRKNIIVNVSVRLPVPIISRNSSQCSSSSSSSSSSNCSLVCSVVNVSHVT
ncbi:uncharacterized protein LOC113040414, partial [Carassius auratus]|uniref:Uncharacterized protein LOC113040414 n=1 Tax=Carassius auratus TaxID=7957 RepID=A0A6P6J2Z6_CARAU